MRIAGVVVSPCPVGGLVAAPHADVGVCEFAPPDRLARDAVEGMLLLAEWLKRGVRLVVLTMQIDFSGEVGQMVASLLLHVAQMERTRIKERQAAGIAAARAAGKRWGGRKPGSGKVDAKRVHELRSRGLKNAEIAAALGVSVRSVIRAAKQPAGSRQVA